MAVKNRVRNIGDDYVQCPYWKAHGVKEIVCSSDIPDANQSIKFPNAKAKDRQMDLFCEGNYKYCPHYVDCRRWEWDES